MSASALAEAGLAPTPFDASLGTIGGGNHFCELQAIEEIVEPEVAAKAGLDRATRPIVLVHSGSRGLGYFDPAAAAGRRARRRSIPRARPAAPIWRSTTVAVRWAALNRRVIAARAAAAAEGRVPRASPTSATTSWRSTAAASCIARATAPADRGLVPIPGLARHAVLSGRAAGGGPARDAGVARPRRRPQVRPRLHAWPRPHRQDRIAPSSRATPSAASSSARIATCSSRKRRRPTRHRPRHRRSRRLRSRARGRDLPAAGHLQDGATRCMPSAARDKTAKRRAGGPAMIRLLLHERARSGGMPHRARPRRSALWRAKPRRGSRSRRGDRGPDPDGHGPASAIALIDGDRRRGVARQLDRVRSSGWRRARFGRITSARTGSSASSNSQLGAWGTRSNGPTCASRRSALVDRAASTRTRPRAQSGPCTRQPGFPSSRGMDARSIATRP